MCVWCLVWNGVEGVTILIQNARMANKYSLKYCSMTEHRYSNLKQRDVYPFHMDAVKRVEPESNSVQSELVRSHDVTKPGRTRVKIPSRTLVKSRVRPGWKRVGSELKMADVVGRT